MSKTRLRNRKYCAREFLERLRDLVGIYDGQLPDQLEKEFEFMKLLATCWEKLGAH